TLPVWRGHGDTDETVEGADLLPGVLLSSHQIREGGSLRRRARRRRVQAALYRRPPRDVGESERLGGRVDPGAALLRRPSHARQQADVRAEDQAQSLLAGRPRGRLVVDLERAIEQHPGRFSKLGERSGRLTARRVRDGEKAADL